MSIVLNDTQLKYSWDQFELLFRINCLGIPDALRLDLISHVH
jgi:hypothetical protein